MLKQIWKPAVYHGQGRRGIFFEGWYFKIISPDLQSRWAVIPGIFKHPDPKQAHAFVQVLNGMSGEVTYHRYPPSAFQASSREFAVRIEDNRFSENGMILDLAGEGQTVQGEIQFSDLHPWPVRWNSPGVMGPYRFAPFMQTYHGVLSLDHTLEGKLNINREAVSFSGGRGYIEKDWGQTFPRAYVWTQSNHFKEEGISLTASAATIPWLGSWFRGFLVGFWHSGRLYRFTTYLGSKIDCLTVSDRRVLWEVTGNWRSFSEGGYPAYRLTLEISRGEGGLLSSPELEGMTPRILESLTAEMEVHLQGLDGSGQTVESIYQGTGTCAALEVAGSVEEIADQAD